MSTTYHEIERAVAVRINALAGTQSTALAATYNTNPLAQTNYQSAVFPRQAVLDAILSAEGKIADAIASTGNHPYRAYLQDVTAPVPNDSVIPPQSGTGKPIIGLFGPVFDVVDNIVCTEQSIETIKRYNRNTDYFICSAYYYKLDGWRVYHTRGTNLVRLDCCSYDRAAQAAIQATTNGEIPLPDALEGLYITGALALLVRDDEFMSQGQMFGQMFDSGIAGIRQGLVNVNGETLPYPTSNAAAT